MKIRFNPFWLGVFIVGAVITAVTAFLAIGPSFFGPAGRFVFYASDSVPGVDAGTTLRFQGIPVGQVDRMRVFYDRNARKSFIAVICRIDKDIVDDMRGQPIRLTDRRVLEQLIGEGLSARIETAGIVGAKSVELGFDSSPAPPAPAHLPPSPYPVIPERPSEMSEMANNVSRILDHLRATDFPGLARQAADLLASARGEIGEWQTNRLSDHFSSAAQSLGQFMKSDELREALARIRDMAADLQTLTTNLDARVTPLATNLNHTLAAADETARNLRDFLALRNELGEQTRQLMEQLDETARDIQQLADYLDRHPNALITGRAKTNPAP